MSTHERVDSRALKKPADFPQSAIRGRGLTLSTRRVATVVGVSSVDLESRAPESVWHELVSAAPGRHVHQPPSGGVKSSERFEQFLGGARHNTPGFPFHSACIFANSAA